MKTFIQNYKLTAENIDKISEEMETRLEVIGVTLSNRLRIRLSYEESLLRMRDHFGEDTEVSLAIGSRMGKPFVEISQSGVQFNPLSKREVSLEDWSGTLLTSVGLYPQYSFSRGKNILRLNLPVRKMNPALKLLIGMAIGTLIGLLFTSILTQYAQEQLIDVVLHPLYELWVRMLSVLSGPVIFLMVMTTVMNTGGIEEEGGDSRKVVFRYFAFSSMMALVTMFVSGFIMEGPIITGTTLGIRMSQYLDRIFHLVPEDALTPIIEANTPQILLMAFVLGNGIVLIGSRAEGISSLVRQFNEVGLLMTDWIGRGVPYIAAALICYEILQKQTGLLRDMWMVIGSSLLISLGCLASALLTVAIRKKVKARVLFRKLLPSFLTAIRSGGLDRGYGEMEDSTVRQLGVERHFAQVSLPHGIILYMPINVVGTLVLTIFGAIQFSVPISAGWLLLAGLMAVIMFVATPPVPGANLLAYIMIFNLLGIPDIVLIDAMIFEVMFGIFASAGNQAMLQIDLILQADRIGLLDKNQLRSKPKDRKE